MTEDAKQLRSDITGHGLYQISWYKCTFGERYDTLASPYVDGAKIAAHWAELEPKEGQYDWGPLDEQAERWIGGAKRVMISVVTGDHSAGTSATPQWVFDAGAKSVTCGARDHTSRTVFPVFWNDVYREKYARFVAALGQRYDMMTGVELVQIGVGHYGECMVSVNVRGSVLEEQPEFEPEKDAWLAAGLSIERWVETVKWNIDVYMNAFPHTLLTLLLCDPALDYVRDAVPQYAQYAADRRIILQNCGVAGEPPQGYRAWLVPLINGFRGRTTTAYETVAPCSEAVDMRPSDANLPGDPPGSFMAKGSLSDVVDAVLRERPGYGTFWAGDLELGTPGSGVYKPGHEKILERAREGLKPGASGPA